MKYWKMRAWNWVLSVALSIFFSWLLMEVARVAIESKQLNEQLDMFSAGLLIFVGMIPFTLGIACMMVAVVCLVHFQGFLWREVRPRDQLVSWRQYRWDSSGAGRHVTEVIFTERKFIWRWDLVFSGRELRRWADR